MLTHVSILKNYSSLYLQKKNRTSNQISKEIYFPLFCNIKLFLHDIISDDQIKFKKKGKSSYATLCPFHQEKTPSFYIEQERGVYHCFGCGESGNLYTFVKKISQKRYKKFEKKSLQDIVYLFNQTKKKFSGINKNNSYLVSYQFIFVIKIECDFYNKFFYKNINLISYTETRGLSNSVLNLYKIGYSYVLKNNLDIFNFNSSVPNFASEITYKNISFFKNLAQNKITMPIFNEKGIIIGFGKRSTENFSKIPKYINSQDSSVFKKQRCVYSSYHFKIVNKFKPKIAMLVEGYIDFVNSIQNGIRFCMASLGTNVNDFHIQKVFSFNKNKHIVISFDCDKPGLVSTRGIVFNLIRLVKIYRFKTSFSYFNKYKDPDELIYFKGGNFFTTFVLNHIKPGLIWVENLCFSLLPENTIATTNSIFEIFFILSKNFKNFNIYYFTIMCNNILLKKKYILSSKVKYFCYKNIHKNIFDLCCSRGTFRKYANLTYKKRKLDFFDSVSNLNHVSCNYSFLVFLFHIRTDFFYDPKSFFFYHDYSRYNFQVLHQTNIRFKANPNIDIIMYYWNGIFFTENIKKVLFENTYDYFSKKFDINETENLNFCFTLKHLSYFFLLEKKFNLFNKKKIGIKTFSKNWFMGHKTTYPTKDKINIFNEKIKFFKNLLNYFESQQFLLEKKLDHAFYLNLSK